MQTKKSKTGPLARPVFLIIVTMVVLLAGMAAFAINKLNTPHVTPAPAPTIHTLPKQKTPVYSPKNPSGSSGVAQGTAVDNNGQLPTPVTTPSNQWTQSQSGLLTVQQPLANSTIKTGFTLSGTAQNISKLQYRLIDSQVGVISQGFINVVNGSFSASVNFKSSASTGRLDVFNTDPTGKEINEVQLPINF